MKKYKKIPVYAKKGVSGIRKVALNETGVYIIFEGSKRVYIGYSASNLYATIHRHFQTWNDPRQSRTIYSNAPGKYTVDIIRCTAMQAPELEKALIVKYRPRDNEEKYKNYVPDSYARKTVEIAEKTDYSDLPF